MTNHPSRSYHTTGPVNSRLVGRVETLLPRHCRSVVCLHGDTDADPVTYRAHRSEFKELTLAIETAEAEFKLCLIS